MKLTKTHDAPVVKRIRRAGPFVDEATRFARLGWNIFPVFAVRDGKCTCGHADCPAPGKHPRVRSWNEKATNRLETIRGWGESWPHANIGAITGKGSGFLVLDIDPRNGGEKSFSDLQKRHGTLPPTVQSSTGGGGRHLFFRCPEKLISTSAGKLGPGIDIKSEKGSVILPPSIHRSGRQYKWIHDPFTSEMAKAPDWLLNLLEKKGAESVHPAPKAQLVELVRTEVPEGSRNNALLEFTGHLLRRTKDLEPPILEELVWAWNRAHCTPPLLRKRVAEIVTSLVHKEAQKQSATLGADHAAERIQFLNPRELASASRGKVDWIAKPFVVRGGITEVTGKIKAAGKTTFILDMVRAVLSGQEFLGYPTRKSRVIFLTEQPRSSFSVALERAGLLRSDRLRILPWANARGVKWAQIVKRVREECREFHARLVVVDTVFYFAYKSGMDENSSGSAIEIMQPLGELASHGIAVVAIRHERKDSGDVGDVGRGSSAFGGVPDILISIRRPSGGHRPTMRELRMGSRFSETPSELMVELTPTGFVNRGSGADAEFRRALRQTREAISSHKEGMTLGKIHKSTGVGRTTAQKVLRRLVKKGIINKKGKGRKGDPYLYFSPVKQIHSATRPSL